MTNEDGDGSQPEAQPPAASSTTASAPASTAPAVKKKESVGDIWKSSTKDAFETVGNTETVIGTHRQIIDAGLLGICVTFLVALLTMQPTAVDANLQSAIIAFGIALPLIGWGYLQAAIKLKEGYKNILLESLLIGSSVGESVGELAAVIGIFFIFRHFSSGAGAAFIWSAVFAVVAVPVLAFIGLFVYAMRKSKELAAKQQAKSAGTPTPGQKATGQTNNNP
ncbi:MAG TPA: hypothetical protein VNG51_19310 [Ktedonobacteraceae bacterium]|nr:hypothetical protein [Ktedonobacteraceae bacterium]